LIALMPASVSAQRYPEKSIRFIAPYAPGGSTDLLARTLAQKLTDSLGQPVVADNRPGAGGNIGADIVAKSSARRVHDPARAGESNGNQRDAVRERSCRSTPRRTFAPITAGSEGAAGDRRQHKFAC
jgi:hypothetical protein